MIEDQTYTIKEYPEEAKKRLETLLEETKEARNTLDKLDELISITPAPTIETLTNWARQAIGRGNYLRKRWAKLEAAAINEKDNRYLEIKMECNKKKITFIDASAKTEAEAYIAPLRTIRNILEAYVVSADNLVSVCRMHLYKQQEEQISEKDL